MPLWAYSHWTLVCECSNQCEYAEQKHKYYEKCTKTQILWKMHKNTKIMKNAQKHKYYEKDGMGLVSEYSKRDNYWIVTKRNLHKYFPCKKINPKCKMSFKFFTGIQKTWRNLSNRNVLPELIDKQVILHEL